MKRLLYFAWALLVASSVAWANNLIPFITGTSGITAGHLYAAGSTAGELVDGGSAAGTGSANTFTAAQTFTQINETAVALTGCNGSTATANLASGTYFSCTVSAGGVTFAVSNVATTGLVSSFTLELTNPGSQTLTFMTGTKWPGGSQPAWTAAGVDLAVCSTRDAGTTWRCVRGEADSK